MTAPLSMIEAEAYRLGFASVVSRDESLFLPTGDWVREFAAGLPAALKPTAIDCDDFAIGAVHFANVALGRSGRRCGHSFGYAVGSVTSAYGSIFLPGITGTVAHAFNLVRTLENEWLIVEPQTGTVESLPYARVRGAVPNLRFLWL